MGVRSFWGGFLGPKMPLLRPENGRDKVLPVLGFFPEFYFCYGAFFRKVLGSELRELYWMCFRWFRVCVFVWIYLSDSGSSFVLPFSGLWGRGFGVRLFFSPLPPSSSPFLSRGRPGFSFFLFCVPADRTSTLGRGRSGLACCVCVLPLLFSLPGSAPLFLALALSLSSLFLSLAKHV